VVSKFGKVSKGWCNFREVADSYRSIEAQTIRLDEDFGFLKPSKEVAIVASELYVAEGAVA